MSRLVATYRIETALDPAHAAAVMAGEQSTGTFVKLKAESDSFLDAHAARIEAVEITGEVATPSLPGAARGGTIRQARVTLSWPESNFGPCLPTVLATVAGNLFELKPFSGLRLEAVHFPDSFAAAFPGPRFGVAGTRRLAGVEGRPLIGTIIKPSVGLSPEATAEQVERLCAGGIDFIKDDELQVDGPHCPFEARVRAVMAVVDRHADRLGRKPMVAFNLTGEIDQMRRRHDMALSAGATCVMVSLNSVGLSGFLGLSRHALLPIHAHRNGWGYLSRHPALGFDYAAWSAFWRLAGADHMHVNGLRNKFCEPDASVLASARACLTPLFAPPHPDCTVMPVFSSGQTPDQVWDTYAALGSADLIHACGGGITAHPDGIAAGVEALRAAWNAALAGTPKAEAAAANPGLARALDFFASVS
ncbi:MAG: ribulose-bisphosphate carboxylase large subunit family protein [Gemmobacter sp.]